MAKAKPKPKAKAAKRLRKAVADPGAESTLAPPPPRNAALLDVPANVRAASARDSNLAWLALVLAGIPAFLELLYLAAAPEHLDGVNVLIVPLAAFAFPLIAIVLSSTLLAGRGGHHVDEGARMAAIAALVLGIAVVATWGIPLLIAMIILASCVQPSPQPCTVTCSQESSQQVCPACPDPGDGCCGGSGSGSGGGGGCCGSGSGSGSSEGGSCCGSSTPATPSVSPPPAPSTPSVGAPGSGFAAATGGLGIAYALRRWKLPVADLSHHPNQPAFRQDVFRLGALRLCVGCFTALPAFLLAATLLTVLPLPSWWVLAGAGLLLASAQALSALGWARVRAAKVAVKSCLGIGLALSVFGVRAAPWSPLMQGLALLALAGLAFASGIPRRRRMAKAA